MTFINLQFSFVFSLAFNNPRPGQLGRLLPNQNLPLDITLQSPTGAGPFPPIRNNSPYSVIPQPGMMGNQGMLGSQGNLGSNSTGKGSRGTAADGGVGVNSVSCIGRVDCPCQCGNHAHSLSLACGTPRQRVTRSSCSCCFDEVSELGLLVQTYFSSIPAMGGLNMEGSIQNSWCLLASSDNLLIPPKDVLMCLEYFRTEV